MGNKAENTNRLAELSPQDIEGLLLLLEERRAQETVPKSTEAARPMRRDAILPKWNGVQVDFGFFVGRLETRIEADFAPFLDDRTICLDVIETLPETAKPRVSAWFERRKADGQFSWRELVQHLKDTFSDRQARQVALEHVNRMEQGENQFFADFLQDFEYRVAQSGGNEAFTQLGKTMTLKAALNNKLRISLVGVKLPPPERHHDWVEEVKEVALELEGLANYRPRGAAQTMTKLGAPKSRVGHITPSRQTVDAEGDIRMSGTNAIIAAVGGSVRNAERAAVKSRNEPNGRFGRGLRENQDERLVPRAPWQLQDEMRRLMREGVYLCCAQG